MKAVVTKVNLFGTEVEGLMLPDGSFGVAFAQAAEINLVPPNRSLKQLNALLGTDFQSHQTKSELNPKAVNYLTLNEFELLIRKLDRKGNKVAQDLTDNLVGLSLVQLFSDAFGVKFEKAERQQWVDLRQQHRDLFRAKFTDWLKADNPNRKDYGTQVDKFKLYAKLPLKPVDEMSADELKTLDYAYITYDTLRRAGFSHQGALERL